jgi:hypothetical protein
MLTLTGIITPVRVNELITRECFCMSYAQQVNLFGIRVMLCRLPATCYLRLISQCVIFSCHKQLKKWVRPSVSPSVHNLFLYYALQDKGQLGYISLCQLGQLGQGVKSGQIRAQVGSSGKCGLVK